MTAVASRFTALDVFRGMTVCLMIVVNTPGSWDSTYAPLLHANWHGFTPTDLVFPSFLFAVGNAMSFVMPKWAGMTRGQVLRKIGRRTLIIFLLGYLMYWFPFVRWEEGRLAAIPFSDTRVFGVLQRIALCYGAAALMIYYLRPRMALNTGIALLFVYWILLYVFGDPADPLSMQGNAGFYLDRWLIGEQHLYHGEGVAFDPEGLLSTLPAIVNVLAGFEAGRFIREKGTNYEALSKLLIAGVLLLAAAWVWNGVFPINKKLWTSSFVLHTVGLDCIILAIIIYIIDFKKITGWNAFFEVFGRNPLFIYLLSELGAILLWFFKTGGKDTYVWVYEKVFSHAGSYFGSLLFALCYMLLCWAAGWWLDRKKIYVRV